MILTLEPIDIYCDDCFVAGRRCECCGETQHCAWNRVKIFLGEGEYGTIDVYLCAKCVRVAEAEVDVNKHNHLKELNGLV